MSLLEILIVCALGSLLMTLIVAVLVPVFKASARSSAQIELQQQALVAMDRLLMDVSTTAPAGVTLLKGDSNRTIVALQGVSAVTATGEQTFADQVVVYDWTRSGATLTRKTWTTPTTAAPAPIALDQVQLVDIADKPGPIRTLAQGVTAFSVTGANTAGVGIQLPLTVDLQLARTLTNRTERYQLTRQIFLQNTH